MIMPSLLTWLVGAAVLAVASLLLRFLADEAQKLARAQGRASVALRPKGGSTYRNAAQQKGVAAVFEVTVKHQHLATYLLTPFTCIVG